MNDGSGHTPNGVHDQTTPELVVNGNPKHLNGDVSQPAPSPAAESPATPISNIVAPDVKIDIDYQEQESDARHEPMPIKQLDSIEKHEDVSSTVPQAGTPLDPGMLSQLVSSPFRFLIANSNHPYPSTQRHAPSTVRRPPRGRQDGRRTFGSCYQRCQSFVTR